MKNITYLLGAGASANAIPVVKDIYLRIKDVIGYLKTSSIPNDTKETAWKIANELEWLLQNSGTSHTIDTLAKKYYLKDDFSNLKRLKRTLITYFALEQSLNIQIENKETGFRKEDLDKRYGSFIAAIAKKAYPISDTSSNLDAFHEDNRGFKLNGQIKILSWNYDMQFEINLDELSQTNILHLKSAYRILPNRLSLNETNNVAVDPKKFAMVKLNGDAIWDLEKQPSSNKASIIDRTRYEKEENRLKVFLETYRDSVDMFEGTSSPLLSFNFAWENDCNYIDKYMGHSKNIENAEFIAQNTEVLVVIGYSFPVFNREIDNKLFSKMTNLKKVYIQDRDPDRIKSTMMNAFKILQNVCTKWSEKELKYIDEYLIKFQLEHYTDQFVIPYELHQ